MLIGFRTINENKWNGLTETVASATKVDTFKSSVARRDVTNYHIDTGSIAIGASFNMDFISNKKLVIDFTAAQLGEGVYSVHHLRRLF